MGGALILTPLLMVHLDPLQAVGVIAPAALVNTTLTAWVHRKALQGAPVGITAAAAVPLCLLGAWIAADVPSWVIEAAIAATIALALGVDRERQAKLGGGRLGAAVWGGIGGLAGGIAGTFGPPLAISFLARGIVGATFVGAMCVLGTTINAVRIPAYVTRGVIDPTLAPAIGVCVGSGVVAVFVGKRLLTRLDPTRFRSTLRIVLGLIGLTLVARVARGVMG